MVKGRKDQGRGTGCEERSPVSGEGLSATVVNAEANTRSPLHTACFAGSSLGKNHTVRLKDHTAAWRTVCSEKNMVTAAERSTADPDLDPGSKFTGEETEARRQSG